MPNIIIKDVPEEVVLKVGTSIKYTKDISFSSKERINNTKDIVYWDDEELSNLGKVSGITSNSF